VIDVKTAIPMVMGANIGTSMTSTLVSLTHMTDAKQFERAFSAATVHDCFNWLAVIVLLIIEVRQTRKVDSCVLYACSVIKETQSDKMQHQIDYS
jgi:uncharacterized membrane protein